MDRPHVTLRFSPIVLAAIVGALSAAEPALAAPRVGAGASTRVGLGCAVPSPGGGCCAARPASGCCCEPTVPPGPAAVRFVFLAAIPPGQTPGSGLPQASCSCQAAEPLAPGGTTTPRTPDDGGKPGRLAGSALSLSDANAGLPRWSRRGATTHSPPRSPLYLRTAHLLI
jgi:hypothetical protein